MAPSKPRKPRRRPVAEPAEPVSPRIVRRERRREQSREEIVEATRRVLLRNGIAGTTLEAVATEVGLTKAALYYYYPSKDAMLFEVMYGALEAQSKAIHDGVEQAANAGEALGAIIREIVRYYASRMDDFRLTYMHGQVAGPGAVHLVAEQFDRIRPLNDLAYAGAAKMLADEWADAPGRAQVKPRLMAFLASMAAIGLLTVKGSVESVGRGGRGNEGLPPERRHRAHARVVPQGAGPRRRRDRQSAAVLRFAARCGSRRRGASARGPRRDRPRAIYVRRAGRGADHRKGRSKMRALEAERCLVRRGGLSIRCR
jgi:AcrR family transcriptional regulator